MAIDDLPLPRPAVEIFVYSSRMEGVHLRGGKVARGGLRWSDRPEDFRTEILGLMKAQMVKNAVIVPVGAKGGFVVKHPPVGDRHIVIENHWQDKAVTAIIDDLYGQQLALTIRVVETAGSGVDATATWADANPDIISRNAQLFTDLRTQPGMDLAMLAVANRRMRELITG